MSEDSRVCGADLASRLLAAEETCYLGGVKWRALRAAVDMAYCSLGRSELFESQYPLRCHSNY
jgi:hypothetical protein